MFFFSSRRRHTRYWRDWSSDVCSSDLVALDGSTVERNVADILAAGPVVLVLSASDRSEERRVGKECRSWWSPYHLKKTINTTWNSVGIGSNNHSESRITISDFARGISR